jgi:hypothetical protein
MITQVNVPMLCVYGDSNYEKCLKEKISEIAPIFETQFRSIKKYFDNNNDAPIKGKLNIILFLFPVMDKEKFVRDLHERLYYLQKV